MPPAASEEMSTPFVISRRQARDVRVALRDWLDAGKDSLTVVDSSLDTAVKAVIYALLCRETEFSAS